MKSIFRTVTLLFIASFSFFLFGQHTVTVDPLTLTTSVDNDFKTGIFYVPKTTAAQQDFQNNGNQYNAIRLHLIESALNNSSNLSECLSYLDLAEVQLQELSQRTDKVIFIFEKMPAWLSSSSDGSPAQTPGWYLLNTVPPADYNAWNNAVVAITDQLVNDFGIDNAYFEIWNEPDLGSWTGTEAAYFELFRNTYDAIKSVDNSLPVGGPATNYWGNHINWQAPYGYLSAPRADSSLIGGLMDSSAVWNRPLDFVSWHNFHIVHNIQENILEYINQKATNLGISVPEAIISEWNTPSILRETSLQPSFFLKNQMELAQTDVSANVIAAWQDFENDPQEFHSDYGLLSYGGIHKPAYKALQLCNRLKGRYIPHWVNVPANIVTTVKYDTVQILLSNYAPDPLAEALNHTLFEGGFTLSQLDSAGFVDVGNASVSYLDSIYKELIPLIPSTPLENAISQTTVVYQHYDSLQSAPQTFQFELDLGMGNYIASADYYMIDGEQNNSIFQYDSLMNEGFTQSGAITEITTDQTITYTHVDNPAPNEIVATLPPNAVLLVELKCPTILDIDALTKPKQFQIYPNPVKNTLTITTDQPSLGCFEILNPSGVVIIERNTNSATEKIAVDNLEPGVYFLRLEEHETVRKFVKN